MQIGRGVKLSQLCLARSVRLNRGGQPPYLAGFIFTQPPVPGIIATASLAFLLPHSSFQTSRAPLPTPVPCL